MNIEYVLWNTYISYNDRSHLCFNLGQGRIGPAAPPPLRAVGPWLNHAFFMNLYVVKHI